MFTVLAVPTFLSAKAPVTLVILRLTLSPLITPESQAPLVLIVALVVAS